MIDRLPVRLASNDNASSAYRTQRARLMRLWRLGWGLFALGILATALAGCPIVREGIMRVTPGVPPSDHCMAPASRCADGVPEVCSISGRWWPATPAGAVCPYGCAVDDGPDGGAYCAAEDGGAR